MFYLVYNNSALFYLPSNSLMISNFYLIVILCIGYWTYFLVFFVYVFKLLQHQQYTIKISNNVYTLKKFETYLIIIKIVFTHFYYSLRQKHKNVILFFKNILESVVKIISIVAAKRTNFEIGFQNVIIIKNDTLGRKCNEGVYDIRERTDIY